ncbi:hypothetical protein ACH4TE_25180 [Streptomyces sioyaensis]|uniref:hypothetical protein n=1 Tax=Streptomyces sioyaensis TaxID=67364 RepID=UPI00379CB677
MDTKHIAALLNYAATVDSRIRRTMADNQRAAATLRTWAEALVDVPATADEAGWNAAHAVRRYYEQHGDDRSARFRAVEPHDLLAAWAGHRAELMNRHTDPVPAADPDDVAAYRAEIVGTRTAVATGQQRPTAYRAIAPAEQQHLAAVTAALGTQPGAMPTQVRDELGRIGIGARRARFPEYAVVCPHPTCRAAERQPCKAPSGRELRDHTHGKRQSAYTERLTAQQTDVAA